MKIVVVGSGNVAVQLGLAFKAAGHDILCVIGRSKIAAQRAGLTLETAYQNNFDKIPPCDFILIAVSDTAISPVAKKIKAHDAIVLHTSGSVSISTLKAEFEKCGVIYPVQTISKNDVIDFGQVPFCIEASDAFSLRKIKKLALSISDNLSVMSSEKRKVLHLAAVIANNFSNHLFTLAADVLKKHKMDFSLLIPLIEQTAKKINSVSPSLAQTGPAKRADKKIISEHLKMLSYNKSLQSLYALLSKSIEQKNRKWKKILNKS